MYLSVFGLRNLSMDRRKLIDTILDIILLFLRRCRSDSEVEKESKEGEG